MFPKEDCGHTSNLKLFNTSHAMAFKKQQHTTQIKSVSYMFAVKCEHEWLMTDKDTEKNFPLFHTACLFLSESEKRETSFCRPLHFGSSQYNNSFLNEYMHWHVLHNMFGHMTKTANWVILKCTGATPILYYYWS